ncbi:MAG: methylhydantoinase [Acidiphilium sp. 37-64-53]|nr:MAG: methylhydantoinase [Acidiphilium sp. 37-64-53]OZB29459.1 MAG: methylhydantoinase [Acidiphilium sp. 34-64-41]
MGEADQTRLAVDIGGTFTDFALRRHGVVTTAKILTTPDAPERAVLEGFDAMLDSAGITPGDIDLLVHGTTLATNAIIERKGAVTAMITTAGFRDVLAMRNESRYDQYDLGITLPAPLIPRHLRLTVPERIDHAGRILAPLDEQAVIDLVPRLRAAGIESLAIGFLHGFTNPVHEQRAAALIAAAWPDLPISLASVVAPEIREWERFSTTAANAYLQPLMARYLHRLDAGLRARGLDAPMFLMLSGGTLTTVETAAQFPIRLVESGPAGGALFAARIAQAAGLDRVVSFDMGGTTAKLCLIDDFRATTARSFEVARIGRFMKGSGLPLRIPVIEMVEIGAGGGSIAAVDPLGRVTVGPDSAGADPGPACYGRGGANPCVTDANLVLGRYDPLGFAGGAMPLDDAAARLALRTTLGTKLDLSDGMAALAVLETVDEAMANAARAHAIDAATSLPGRTLIAFGGGGPVHATRIAEKLGIDRVLVPRHAGVGSAIGFLHAPVGYEVVRSLYQRLDHLDLDLVNAWLDDMQREAVATVEPGRFGAPVRETRSVAMRYVGQGHEIMVGLPPRRLDASDIIALRHGYEAEYARIYDRPVPGSAIEMISYVVSIETIMDEAAARPVEPVPHDASPIGHRLVRDSFDGRESDWSLYERAALAPGARLRGPAIVQERETSTLLGPGWSGMVMAQGWIDLVRDGAA